MKYITAIILVFLSFPLSIQAGSKGQNREILIERNCPGYRVVSLKDMEKTYLQIYLKDKNVTDPGVAIGDFDGNNKQDYAFSIVRENDPKDEKIIALLAQDDSSYKLIIIETLRFDNTMFIRTTPPGKYYQFDDESININAKNDCIRVNYFEQSEKILYWDGKGFREIWTED